jgi:hypothetical protein
VATGRLNVATGGFSKSYILVERSIKLQHLQHISLSCGDSKEKKKRKKKFSSLKYFCYTSAIYLLVDNKAFFRL